VLIALDNWFESIAAGGVARLLPGAENDNGSGGMKSSVRKDGRFWEFPGLE
jgi:hypothetical protein